MNAIEVKDIQKKFKVYLDKGQTIKERLLFRNRNRYEERWVLKGISFEVKKGEAIGLVGHNGCGKSTLLKLMTRILYPDTGSIKIQGRVSSLIELGAGFHPDMSGRENIYINASIFGLTKKEIDERLDAIIDFSELHDFIDNPVRTYSSGMYMRLAFSVAINVDADVLLIDEILAVGDAAFQSKCFDKLMDIKGKGTTIVIVSHALTQIEQICDKSIWIDNGLIRMQGAPNEVHPKYMEFMGEKRRAVEVKTTEIDKQEEEEKEKEKKEKEKESIAKIISAELINEKGEAKNNFKCGEKVSLHIKYEANPEKAGDVLIGLMFYRADNAQCYGTNTQIEGYNHLKLNKKGEIICKFDKLNFVAGSYWVDIAIRAMDMFAYDYKDHAVRFSVYSNVGEVGIAKLDHAWTFN